MAEKLDKIRSWAEVRRDFLKHHEGDASYTASQAVSLERDLYLACKTLVELCDYLSLTAKPAQGP